MLSPCDMFPPNLKSEVSVPSPSLLRLRMMQCVLLLGQVAEQAATTQKVDQCHPLPPEEDGGAQQQPQCVHYLPPTQRFISVKPPPTHAPHSSYDASPLSVHREAMMPSPIPPVRMATNDRLVFLLSLHYLRRFFSSP